VLSRKEADIYLLGILKALVLVSYHRSSQEGKDCIDLRPIDCFCLSMYRQGMGIMSKTQFL